MPTITTGVVYQGEVFTFSTFAVSTGLVPIGTITIPEYWVVGYEIEVFSRPEDSATPGRKRTIGLIYRGTGDAINNYSCGALSGDWWYEGSVLPYISGSVVTFKVDNHTENQRLYGVCRIIATKQEWSVP